MEYELVNSYLNKADKYLSLLNPLKDDNEEFEEKEVIILIETAIECYLSAVLEETTEKPIDIYFGNNYSIPHGGHNLYDEIYPKGKLYHIGEFSKDLRAELKSVFIDYSIERFPKRELKYWQQEPLLKNINDHYKTLLKIKEFANLYIKESQRIKEDQKEKGE